MKDRRRLTVKVKDVGGLHVKVKDRRCFHVEVKVGGCSHVKVDKIDFWMSFLKSVVRDLAYEIGARARFRKDQECLPRGRRGPEGDGTSGVGYVSGSETCGK